MYQETLFFNNSEQVAFRSVSLRAKKPSAWYCTQNNAPPLQSKGLRGEDYSQFQDFFPKIDFPSSGKIGAFPNPSRFDSSYIALNNSRLLRYRLKSVAASLLPSERVARCRCYVVPGKEVSIRKLGDRAYFTNLEVCSSVWSCPCCAAKISESRRCELVSAISEARKQGLFVYMMTLTVPHYKGSNLRSLIDSMTSAYSKLFKDRAGKNLIKKYGIIGRIRSFEVTYGKNGFHPHFHVLIFTDAHCDLDSIKGDFYPVWKHCCSLNGLSAPSFSHGVVFNDGSFASRYVSKWGLEHEMTKSHLKISKGVKGMSMFDFLRKVYFNPNDLKSKSLFIKFFEAFKGRRQLVWTKGLKDRLLVEDTSDEELAQDYYSNSEHVVTLSRSDFFIIRFFRAETFFLTLAETGKELKIFDFLFCLRNYYYVFRRDIRNKKRNFYSVPLEDRFSLFLNN